MVDPDIDGADKFSSACLFIAGLWIGIMIAAIAWGWSLL